MIEEAAALEGMALRIEQWNHEASLDSIRHYAWGIGDNNPLWCDEAYAATARFGKVAAPPTFLYSVYTGAMGIGLVGVQAFGVGTRWEFYHPVLRNDRVAVDAKVGPIEVKSGSLAERFVLQTTANEYVRADGTILARSWGRTARVPRSGARGGLQYKQRDPHQYTTDELEAIRQHVINQPLRGATPRYWEDVPVGEELPPVVKGPLDQLTMTAYYAGSPGSPATKSADLRWQWKTWAAESPDRITNIYDTAFWLEDTGVPVTRTGGASPAAGHQDADVARQIGMPGRYGNASQKSAWMAHTVLNWMGDAGDVVELDFKLRRPDVYGDTAWCRAHVKEKVEPDLVRIELSSDNQLGTVTATGRATVRLPRRTPAAAGATTSP